MFLKKINPLLEEALADIKITKPTQVQEASFSKIKSGAECMVFAPAKSGKTTQAAISTIQKLNVPVDDSPRVLIMVNSRKDLEEMTELFDQLTTNSDLRIYIAREKGDLDYEKNVISCGIDALVGTPQKLGELLITAGYNVNELELFIVDDLDLILDNKFGSEIEKISRLLPEKTKRIFFSTIASKKVQGFADRLLNRPTEIRVS